MSGDTTYLLAIALGPVQDFIAASRKARDLWYGSSMLSQLSRVAAKSLEADPGTELIFPASDALTGNHAVANKLLVSTTGNPAALADAARKAVRETLEGMWNALVSTIGELSSGTVDTGLAREQLEDFVEWYAAWVPYEAVGYEDARQRVERLLAGRKTLREFNPAAGRDMRPKSSLDPSRESIVDLTNDTDRRAARRLRLKGSEALDGISLIKRLSNIKHPEDEKRLIEARFVSTSRVAIDPFIRALRALNPACLDDLRNQAEALDDTDLVESFHTGERTGLDRYKDFPFDSQLFYEASVDSVRNTLTRELPGGPSAMQVDAVRNILSLIRGFTNQHRDWRELPAYYAVLRADGDRMGKAIGALKKKQDHQTLSTQLGTFAERAGAIVREHFGAMIYSGGDDVLAFLPLDTALPCADALRLEFSEIIRNALQDHPKLEQPTLSVGIAIGHYAEHLQTMLRRAGDAEKAAKGPRNALAVSFQAHSGGGDPRTVVHSWNDDPVQTHWAIALEFHRHDTLPDGAAYELDALRREFRAAQAHGVFPSGQAAAKLLVKETVRILKRKRVQGGTKKVQEEIIDNVQSRLESPPEGQTPLDVLGSCVNEVIVARRMYRLLMDPGSAAFTLWYGALTDVKTSASEAESTLEPAAIATEVQS